MRRYLHKPIQDDLSKKMVFLGGPRQVGKTTLALDLVKKPASNYLNWDIAEDREKILSQQLPSSGLLVLDEVHKYSQWRQLVKGLYDKAKARKYRPILVTGSAHLDYYRYGGDSLQGRYYFHRLHPISLAELGSDSQTDLASLFKLGGFPEPFLGSSEKDAKRWSRDYRNRLIQDDIIPIENVSDIAKLEHLMLRLPDLVGSPLSVNQLRSDLQIAHKTLVRWLDILERFYGVFRLAPFGNPKVKAVKKNQKHYHFDWTLVKTPGERFENLVACHLLKWVHYQQDIEGGDLELRFFQDLEKREVDFVICEGSQPKVFVECKYKSETISPHLIYLSKKFPNSEFWQITLQGKKDFANDYGIRVCPARVFLKTLI